MRPRRYPTKTYTLLGVARGQSPVIRSSSLEAPDSTVNAVPDLVRRAAIAILGTIAAVSIMAVFIPSPLEEPANALVTPNPAKAPWYFLWLQEIVTDTTIHLGSFTINGAFLGGVVLPGLLVTLLTLWPWLDRTGPSGAGLWMPRDRRTQNLVFFVVVAIILVFTFIGLVHARAVLGSLHAVGDVARHPVEDLMERRTNSPYPAIDRPVMALIGLVLVVATGLFIWSDRAHDWRYYQYEFRRQVGEQFGAPKADGVPSGMQQVWVADLGRADRCITCHQGVAWKGFENAEQPYRTHPVEPLKAHPVETLRVYVVPRRPGLGGRHRAAHGEVAHWEEPLLSRTLGESYTLATSKTALMQMNCNQCHRYDRETRGADAINLAKRLVLDKGCRACHVINGYGGTIGPDLTEIGEKAPEQYDFSRLSGQRTAFAWHVAHFKDPRALIHRHGDAELQLHHRAGAGAQRCSSSRGGARSPRRRIWPARRAPIRAPPRS